MSSEDGRPRRRRARGRRGLRRLRGPPRRARRVGRAPEGRCWSPGRLKGSPTGSWRRGSQLRDLGEHALKDVARARAPVPGRRPPGCAWPSRRSPTVGVRGGQPARPAHIHSWSSAEVDAARVLLDDAPAADAHRPGAPGRPGCRCSSPPAAPIATQMAPGSCRWPRSGSRSWSRRRSRARSVSCHRPSRRWSGSASTSAAGRRCSSSTTWSRCSRWVRPWLTCCGWPRA